LLFNNVHGNEKTHAHPNHFFLLPSFRRKYPGNIHFLRKKCLEHIFLVIFKKNLGQGLHIAIFSKGIYEDTPRARAPKKHFETFFGKEILVGQAFKMSIVLVLVRTFVRHILGRELQTYCWKVY